MAPAATAKKRIGITIGDYNGIGPELILRTFKDPNFLADQILIVYGSKRVLDYYAEILGINYLEINLISKPDDSLENSINLIECSKEEVIVEPGTPSRDSASMAKNSLELCAKHLKEGRIQAVVTCPVNKESLQSQGFDFPGQTEFFSQVNGSKPTMMLLASDILRIGLVTGHVPLSDLSTKLNSGLVEEKFRVLERSLKKNFGIKEPRIGILGINPHAGENGKIGSEEVDWLGPLIEKLKKEGNNVEGPLPADGLFGSGNFKSYDAILGMYHDQALIPFKTLAFEDGVNCTIGMDFIRTSPDHGTAYDIAGKGIASIGSLRASLKLAKRLVSKQQNL